MEESFPVSRVDRPERYYDAIAQSYDAQRFGCRCGRILNDVEIRIARELVAPGGRILDVGTGTARFAAAVGRASSAVVALDASHRMLSAASATISRGEPQKRVSLVAGDAFSLPFISAGFDTVMSIKLLSHYRDIEPIVSEMARVLKRNCQLVLYVPRSVAESYAQVAGNPSVQSYLDFFHPFPEIARVLRKHSIEISRRVTYSALPLSIVHATICRYPVLAPTRILKLLIGARGGVLTLVEGIKKE